MEFLEIHIAESPWRRSQIKHKAPWKACPRHKTLPPAYWRHPLWTSSCNHYYKIHSARRSGCNHKGSKLCSKQARPPGTRDRTGWLFPSEGQTLHSWPFADFLTLLHIIDCFTSPGPILLFRLLPICSVGKSLAKRVRPFLTSWENTTLPCDNRMRQTASAPHVNSEPKSSVAVDTPKEKWKANPDHLSFLLGQYHMKEMVQPYIHLELVVYSHPSPTIPTHPLAAQW